MPSLYRVFPWRPASRPHEPGSALFTPPQGGGRIDNPALYSVLYLGNSAPGAIAEAFGRFPEWTASILEGSPALPGSSRALARYRLSDDSPVCDLEDARRLLALKLRPSEVVTRDYARTRLWAGQIHAKGAWDGICWWSFYNSDWLSFGLWERRRLVLEDITPLTLDNALLLEAGRMIVRRVVAVTSKRNPPKTRP